MISWLNYTYYRMTKAYIRWDGTNGIVGILSVTMIESMLFLDICLFCLSFFYKRSELKTFPFHFGYIAFGVFLVVFALNYWLYSGAFEKYNAFWKEERKSLARIKGVIVVLTLLLPWFLFFLIDRYS